MHEIFSPFPNVNRITLGSSNVMTEVRLPRYTKRVSVRFISNDGKVVFDGTDQTSVSTHYATVDADVWMEFNWTIFETNNRGRLSIYLASATGSTVVEVIVEG